MAVFLTKTKIGTLIGPNRVLWLTLRAVPAEVIKLWKTAQDLEHPG